MISESIKFIIRVNKGKFRFTNNSNNNFENNNKVDKEKNHQKISEFKKTIRFNNFSDFFIPKSKQTFTNLR